MRELLHSFTRSTRGNVAMMFAIAMLPTIGLAGAAVDYSRASNARDRLQVALDGAVLNVAKSANGLTEQQIQAAIQKQVKPVADAARMTGFQLTASVDQVSSRVDARASAALPTTLTSVLGFASMPVAVASQGTWATPDLEIALVLDNTGSMGETLGGTRKIDSLKTAAQNFIKFMQGLVGNKPGGIKIGVVPFDTNVHIDNQLEKSFWVYQDIFTQWGGWSGCIYDRDQPNDVLDTTPGANTSSTLFRADPMRAFGSLCSLAPIAPLTNNLGSLDAPIRAMAPSGNTNLTIGLAWGFHILTPGEPITNAAPFGTVQKFVILMTDGMNTQNRWTTNSVLIDDRTRQVCTNIKKTGIQIYTIGTPDANASLLKDCATLPDMYFGITDGSELDPVFQQIASRISKLRLSR